MDATDQATCQTKDPVILPIRDSLDALGNGPLGAPVRALWAGLYALVREGRLLGVELDLRHPDCPSFLLDAADGLPQLYVEVFPDDSSGEEEYDPEAEGRPLLVQANWLGEDTDPTIFELDPALLKGDPSAWESALAPMLDHVLWMTQSRG